MEAVVYEDSPLASYLEGNGGEHSHDEETSSESLSSKESSPSFAPRGRPKFELKQRNKLPPPLRLSIPQSHTVAALHRAYSRAITSRLGRADNERFLEQFRYTIVASQLLNSHTYHGQTNYSQTSNSSNPNTSSPHAFSTVSLAGASATALAAFSMTWLIHWTRKGERSLLGRSRFAAFFLVSTVLGVLLYAYTRRQWLKYLRTQAISDITAFVAKSQEFDHVTTSALTLVQEVELVSRGYRISAPLPPISRLEEGSQSRRCARLRKTIRICFADVIPRYKHACAVLKPLADEMDLEKYYDIYDISDYDFSDAMRGYSETEFEDIDAIRTLKILASRFHTSRKIFLSCLMALDANGGKSDYPRWNAALEEIHMLFNSTCEAEDKLRRIYGEEESFSIPPTPKIPMTPTRERWRAQLRQLNSLSSGIRGLQAKLHVLRDESDRNLQETEDVSELGTNLMIQYESIGLDLKSLMHEWEEGKAALASNIDRNERRVSSMSGMLSPTTSLGGMTAVEEGNASDALKALNGETRSRSSMDFSSSDMEEVFEAVALPRPRSTLTRDERIAKMKEDRSRRESVKSKVDENTHMLRELESVIKLRPRGRTTPGPRLTPI